MSKCKKYNVIMSAQIGVEVFAKDEDEARVLAWEHCQDNSGNFADWVNVEKVEEMKW